MSNPYDGLSITQNEPGLTGQNTAGGTGVLGSSDNGHGVEGDSANGNGVFGTSTTSDAVVGFATAQGKAGVLGLAPSGNAVAGISDNGTGVFGSGKAFGIVGTSTNGEGIHAHSDTGNAVHGDSGQSDAVVGFATAQGKAGVLGLAPSGNAVVGISDNGTGVFGKGGQFAGYFDGNVQINGNVTIASGGDITFADFSEEFDVTTTGVVEPGTVMVLDRHGALQPSQQAYDKKVAGVISSAGDYKPGLILDKRESAEGRMPVALVGKVYCKVDAQYTPIEIGDLLTTSPTPGHAMKADDPLKAFGSVIGKALRPLREGQGLIPILIALQ